jgi:hypothetical protein
LGSLKVQKLTVEFGLKRVCNRKVGQPTIVQATKTFT